MSLLFKNTPSNEPHAGIFIHNAKTLTQHVRFEAILSIGGLSVARQRCLIFLNYRIHSLQPQAKMIGTYAMSDELSSLQPKCLPRSRMPQSQNKDRGGWILVQCSIFAVMGLR